MFVVSILLLFLYVFFKSCFSYMHFYLDFKATFLMVPFYSVFFRIIEKFFSYFAINLYK